MSDLDKLKAASEELKKFLAPSPASQPRTGKTSEELAEQAKRKAEREAKRKAKQDELRAGGRRAAEKDWVRRYAEGKISRTTKLEAVVQIKVRAEPVPEPPSLGQLTDAERAEAQAKFAPSKPVQSFEAPKPVPERTVEELYTLLLAAFTRYNVVLANPKKGTPGVAWRNFRAVADLLMDKGESEDALVAFIQQSQEGGE